MIKVLNLYAGIGGNRKLWKDVEVTAVENVPEIAEIYKKNFPADEVKLCDAHKYLLEHFNEFDFIWSSPPCPTHSQMRYRLGFLNGQVTPIYPDMTLYQEIIFLKHYYKGKWVVENVEPYYEPLIKPQICGRHRFWSNFIISNVKENGAGVTRWGTVEEMEDLKGFVLGNVDTTRKRTLLRNCVNPDTGLHVFNAAFKDKQMTLGEPK